ncbi:MAG: YggT family protein [Ktedonobacterales bacterium]
MVQPHETPDHEWSDAPTVPIKPDRYAGNAPTWPGASPPPPQRRYEQPSPGPGARQTPAPVPAPIPPTQPWYIQRAPGIIRLTLTVIEILIAIRIVLKLLAANPAAEFTSIIYALTDIFIAPFQGVFPNPRGDGNVLELSALLAIPIYALLARLCVSIANIVRGRYPTPRP